MTTLQERVKEMCASQLLQWPLAAQNYEALNRVLTRELILDGQQIRVQFNPARIVSSAAKVDKKSIEQRRCFLCPEHLPEKQLRLTFLDKYNILCNPYPIFHQHLTIPAIEHVEQCIQNRLDDMMELSRELPDFTIFYNGPRCGASAPDHMHFQASPFGAMPLDKEVDAWMNKAPKILYQTENNVICQMNQPLRSGLVISSSSREEMEDLFRMCCSFLPLLKGEKEPMMNLFMHYQLPEWRLIIIPRRLHRPKQYFAEEAQRFISSPGAADVGGLFITVRQEDFDRASQSLLADIYHQVCYDAVELEEMIKL